jgi:HAMP domain-containing protein
VPDSLFVFVQFEFPWALGPPDGRYLLRAGPDADAERVVVLGQLVPGRPGIGTAPPRRRGRLRRRFDARRPATPTPAPVTTTRATVIDPVALAVERQARAWLADLDAEREVLAAAAIVNRVVQLHRLAAADPYVREIAPAQALVIRAGWGAGEQVADGAWMHARELQWQSRRTRGPRRDRSSALRPQERLAALLGGRTRALLCEELTLRARMDVDQGRARHAALQLERAYAAAIPELRAEGRHDLAIRVAELEKLSGQVADAAAAALDGEAEPDPEVIEHALVRLESALRARSAAGFSS